MNREELENIEKVMGNMPDSLKERIANQLLDMMHPEDRKVALYMGDLAKNYESNPNNDLLLEGIKMSNFDGDDKKSQHMRIIAIKAIVSEISQIKEDIRKLTNLIGENYDGSR